MNHLKTLTMVSMKKKVLQGTTFERNFQKHFTWMSNSRKGNRVFVSPPKSLVGIGLSWPSRTVARFFNDLKMDNITTMSPGIISFDLVFYISFQKHSLLLTFMKGNTVFEFFMDSQSKILKVGTNNGLPLGPKLCQDVKFWTRFQKIFTWMNRQLAKLLSGFVTGQIAVAKAVVMVEAQSFVWEMTTVAAALELSLSFRICS